MKQVIRINENHLRRVIKESVTRALRLNEDSDGPFENNPDLTEQINKVWNAFNKMKAELDSHDRNYSIPAMFLAKAMRGDERAKETLFTSIKFFSDIDDDVLNAVFEVWKDKQ